jgi:hypothetical protein
LPQNSRPGHPQEFWEVAVSDEVAEVEIRPGQVFSPAQREAEARSRAGRIRQGIDGQGAVFRDIRDAVARKDWEALGYGSPAEYFEKERITERWRAAEGSQRELVAELRAAGLSQAAVGAAVGITQGRVSQLERGKTGHETRRSQEYKPANAGQRSSGRPRKAAGQPSASRPSRDGTETETGTGTETAAATQADTDTGTRTAAADGQGAQEPADGTEAAARPQQSAGPDEPSVKITGDPGDYPGAGQEDGAAQEPGLAELKAENARLHELAAELELVRAVAAELAALLAGAVGGWAECGDCHEPWGLPVRAVNRRSGKVLDSHACAGCVPSVRDRHPGWEFAFIVPGTAGPRKPARA